MSAALLLCLVGGEGIDGEERAGVLKRTFEYIDNNPVDVAAVQKIDKQRDSKFRVYHALLFADGSHLRQCRTLQVLGLGCPHLWAAMRLNAKFRFHVVLLHQHWLAEKARGTPEGDWPSAPRRDGSRWINTVGRRLGERRAPGRHHSTMWAGSGGLREQRDSSKCPARLEGEGSNPTGQTSFVRRRLKDARTSKQHFV